MWFFPYRSYWLLGLLLSLGVSCLAQDDSVVQLQLMGENTRPYSGTILEADEKHVEIRLDTGGTMTLETDRLDATSLQHVYQHMRKTWDLQDPNQRLRLGEFCQQQKLFLHAETHYRAVLSLDPDQTERVSQKLASLQQAHLQHLLQTALDALSAGHHERAARYLRQLARTNPSSEEGKAATKILAEIVPSRPEEKEEEPKPTAPPLSRWTRAMNQLVLPRFQKAQALHRQGLHHEGERRSNRGSECYKEAIEALDRAETKAKLVEKHCRKEPDLPNKEEQQSYRELQTEMRQLRIRLYLALANHHAAARRLERAREFTNLALSVDPDDRRALDLRDRITDEILRRGAR